jgi:hypothetical protein
MVNKITFEGEKSSDDIIEEILKKNGFEEDLSAWLEKTEKNEKVWFESLYKLAKNLAEKKITELIFLTNIQQQFNISEEIAKNILKDVKEKLLPIARIIDDEIEQDLEDNKTTLLEKQKITPIQNIKPAVSAPTTKKILKKKEISDTPLPQQQKRKTDTYREPIE